MRMMFVFGCFTLLGCQCLDPVIQEFKVPNLLGTVFKDKEDVADHIPAGTPVENARTVMREHGFAEWSSQRHGDHLTLVFHRFDPANLRKPEDDIWITIFFEHGTVVNLDVTP